MIPQPYRKGVIYRPRGIAKVRPDLLGGLRFCVPFSDMPNERIHAGAPSKTFFNYGYDTGVIQVLFDVDASVRCDRGGMYFWSDAVVTVASRFPALGAAVPNATWSLSCWYYTEAVSNFMWILHKANIGLPQGAFFITANATGALDCGFTNGGVIKDAISPANTLKANRWTHLGATYDGANVRVYCDGRLVASAAQANTGFDIDGNLTFNESSVVGTKNAGMRYAMVWYDRVISGSQMNELYLAPSPFIDDPTTQTPPGPPPQPPGPPTPSFALQRPNDFLDRRFDTFGTTTISTAPTTEGLLFRTSNIFQRTGTHRTFVAFVAVTGGRYFNLGAQFGSSPAIDDWSPVYDLSQFPSEDGGVIYVPQLANLYPDGVGFYVRLTDLGVLPPAPNPTTITFEPFGWWI